MTHDPIVNDDSVEWAADVPEATPPAHARPATPWKVLLVDDESTVHTSTRFALETLEFQGRPLRLLSALSGAAARAILLEEKNIALALVDVVMETDHSGLDLVRFIRNELGNRNIRLILRTGQPGYAPEAKVMIEYEIDDYKLKTDLTVSKLTTTVISGLRAYGYIAALTHLTEELETRVESRTVALATANAELTVVADKLSQSVDTLRQLSDIGNLLTASLQPLEICRALERHLAGLLPLDGFGITLLGTAGATLDTLYRTQDGEIAPPLSYPLDHPTAMIVRTFREQRELTQSDEIRPAAATMAGSTMRQMQSAMYRRLIASGQAIGVIDVQSYRPDAYQQREVEILRATAASVAIALANASIYSVADSARKEADHALVDLRATQTQLIQAEKMASLGQLITSVAHEINTPMSAVKSSGRSIADSMAHALENMPQLFKTLDTASLNLFLRLINHRTNAPTTVFNSREERATRREVAQKLDDEGIDNIHYKASILVQLRAQSALADYLPLLRHPACGLILDTAQSVAGIINSADNINTAVDRVSRIVFALKSFSQAGHSDAMKDADLSEGLESVLTIYQRQVTQSTQLIRHYEKIAPVPCLAEDLIQVWTNLIHNALQAMNHQGTLTVGIRRVGDEAVVSIGDSGCGIPEAIRERIFDPFFTTKPPGEGSGLGLDIARRIVTKHQGRIEFRSEVGVGTTFLIYLPYATKGP